MQELSFSTRNDFRRWLEINHDKSDGFWLVYFKKHTKMPSVSYAEAVEEALCFGWIDSKVQTIDELRYRQIFTPRNRKSVWSVTNKERVKRMIEEGRMTPAGMKLVDAAKKNGEWEKAYGTTKVLEIPEELKIALQKNPQAWENFNNFAPSYRSIYIGWVTKAQRPETIKNRISKVVESALKNLKSRMN